MKDIVITSRQIRKEIQIWLVLFGLSNLINVAAIIGYETSWHELYSQIIYVLFLSIFLYIFILLLRALIKSVKSMIIRK